MPWQAHSRREVRLALVVGVLALLVASASTPVGAAAPSASATPQSLASEQPGGAGAASPAGEDAASSLWPLLVTLGILTALVVLAGFVFRATRLTASNGHGHRPEVARRSPDRPATDRADRDRVVELLRATDRPPTEAHIAEALAWSPARTRQAVMKLVAESGALRYETDERAQVVFIGSRRHGVDDEERREWSPNGRRPPH